VAHEPDPFTARYAWTVKWNIDRARVRDLAQRVVGEHDFAGFCSAGASAETTVRTIHSVEVSYSPVVGPCVDLLLPAATKAPSVIAGSAQRDEPISSTESRWSAPISPLRASGSALPASCSECFRIEFTGNGFLYKMVRNLVGTIIDIARGQLPESALDERLHAPMPYAGFTAPARGLFLVRVDY
jgi:tRNA pseudouridine38-40 synthase